MHTHTHTHTHTQTYIYLVMRSYNARSSSICASISPLSQSVTPPSPRSPVDVSRSSCPHARSASGGAEHRCFFFFFRGEKEKKRAVSHAAGLVGV